MRTPAAVLTGAVIGAAACYFAVHLYERRDMDDYPECEARVVIARNPSTNTFEVKPKNVCVFVGHHLKWQVHTPANDKVEIVFDDPKAFAYDATNLDNTSPGVYTTTPATTPKEIGSNAAQAVGRKPYKVKWTHGTVTEEIDPAVCIRN